MKDRSITRNKSWWRRSEHSESHLCLGAYYCLACLRKIKRCDGLESAPRACQYCGSTSRKLWKSWFCRPPKRTASKRQWRDFIALNPNNEEPEDFMRNV